MTLQFCSLFKKRCSTHSLCYFRCCDWGEGSYQLAFDGTVVANGGSFGQSETKSFSTPSSGGTASTEPTDSECYDVSISLTFDMYSEDTSWDIMQGSSIIAKSQPYNPKEVEIERHLCLPPGEDYVFTIYDVYQDGM